VGYKDLLMPLPGYLSVKKAQPSHPRELNVVFALVELAYSQKFTCVFVEGVIDVAYDVVYITGDSWK